MTRSDVWFAAEAVARSAERGALATIARRRGSLPMATDAKMLVTAEGRRVGTVGGGCVEADVAQQALRAVTAGSPALVRHTLNADVAGDIGLSCGGTAEFFLEPVVNSSEMADLYATIGAAVDKRETATVLTALDWSRGPRKQARSNFQALSVGDFDGVTPPRPDRSKPNSYVDEGSGLFVEWVERIPRVVIFGAGHVGREIARVASGAGFYVVVTDDRAEFANKDRMPDVHEVIVRDFRTLLDEMVFDEDDFVLATTRGHSFDAYIVERAAPSRARYVGMLGSQRKREVIWRALEAAGVAQDALRRVRVPIGEGIGAETPAEIAVSVVAELIRVRRLGGPH